MFIFADIVHSHKSQLWGGERGLVVIIMRKFHHEPSKATLTGLLNNPADRHIVNLTGIWGTQLVLHFSLNLRKLNKFGKHMLITENVYLGYETILQW